MLTASELRAERVIRVDVERGTYVERAKAAKK